MDNDHEYTMTINLSVLDHLGINLYSNVPAVVSEVVANSWDADASRVRIALDIADQVITIVDDGCGMSKAEINDKYLHVGYRRREAEPLVTNKGRHVMGRKGIGKLSLFSIADTIEVHSVKLHPNGRKEKSGCVMNTADIRSAIERHGDQYHPKPVDPAHIKIENGTGITLRDLKRDLNLTEPFLRRRLARRFSIMGSEHQFRVVLNQEEIGVEDRDYFKKIEYLWCIGDEGQKYRAYCTNCKESNEVDGIVDAELGYRITGWVGTFDEQKSLEEGSNTIVVLAWGKLIHEDLLKDLKEAGIYASYLIGEIRADFVDDDEPDMATSDRQRLIESDQRFIKLKDYVQKEILKEIQTRWTGLRNRDAEKKARENPKIDEWFRNLGPDHQKYARALFGKIESFPISDSHYKKELYRHAIIAFETLALKHDLGLLDKISSEQDLERLGELFADMDSLEEAHYYQIVKSRVEVLQKFEEMLNADAKERVIQNHIFDHLWLLSPSWERATTDKRMEKSVMAEVKKVDVELTDEEKRARLDIRYRTAAGKHIIIELKKYGATVQATRLAEQVRKYRDALRKVLRANLPDQPHQIEVICILGCPPTPRDDDEDNRKALSAYSGRYKTYDELILETRESYRDYLETSGKIKYIQELIDSL